MVFLTVLLIIGLSIIGAFFCIALIGGPPWSKKTEGASIKIGRNYLTVPHAALGFMVLVLGLLWLIVWIYLSTVYGSHFYSGSLGRAIHFSMQPVLATLLILTGITILKNWRRWRGLYLFCVTWLAINVVAALLVGRPRNEMDLVFSYILPIIALGLVGGVVFLFYIFLRVLRISGQNL